MSPKIKRKLKVYNDRYKDIFKMSIGMSPDSVVTLSIQYEGIDYELFRIILRLDGTAYFAAKECGFPISIPGPISDFLYYGMAILEDMKGDQK